MKFIAFILALLISFPCLAKEGDEEAVRVGDSIAAVRNHMGEPKIEFPLNGTLVQDYGYCIITSCNGVVTSIKKKSSEASGRNKKGGADSVAPSFNGQMKKAKNGDVEAQFSIAYCYQTGQAVEKNMDEAIRWYTLAAMEGHVGSQHNLGCIYLRGEGVPRDFEQAYTWAVLAAGNGNDELLKMMNNRVTEDKKSAAFARAQRIRDGLEESPYGYPDENTAIAQTTDSNDTAAAKE